MPKNPILSSTKLNEVIEETSVYKLSKKQAFYEFKRNFEKDQKSSQPFFKNLFLNFSYLTSFSFVLILGFLLLLGGLTAQALAPNDYKPTSLISNIFSKNRQKETDPYSALSPDLSNYVASLEPCDLAFKFPRLVNNTPLVFEKVESKDRGIYSIYYDYANYKGQFNIECAGKDNTDYYHLIDNNDLTKNSQIKNISKLDLQKSYGWFITEGEMENIQEYNSADYTSIIFSKNNKKYRITKYKSGSLNLDQIQFQFQSLVKNTFSDDLLTDVGDQNKSTESNSCLDYIKVTFKNNLTFNRYTFNDTSQPDTMIITDNLNNSDLSINCGVNNPEILRTIGTGYTFVEIKDLEIKDFKVQNKQNLKKISLDTLKSKDNTTYLFEAKNNKIYTLVFNNSTKMKNLGLIKISCC